MTRVRVRGIYATVLTQLLGDAATIVQASDAIAGRFDTAFPQTDHEVDVRTTADRLGVGVIGESEDVAEIRNRLADVARDALAWDDATPRGAIAEATVTETFGQGAEVDLGSGDGFLPYDAVDGSVDDGDTVRVQVHDPAPPWVDHRPTVGTEIRAFGGLADLVREADGPRADVADPDRASELIRSTAMLPADVPDGWAVRWTPAAADAPMEHLDTAIEFATGRVDAVDAALEGGPPPAATAWVWFGRESRFELDAIRREVVPTLSGHHRIKAGSDAAGMAVDFAERLAPPLDDFPFEIVADVFGPAEGDEISIEHGKPDGRRFSLGRGDVVDRDGDTITVRRTMSGGGEYDALAVPRSTGDTATTKLTEGRWWYPTVYRDAEGVVKGTYVNICTPVELFPEMARYMDLEVDVVRHADGGVERVDDDELAAAVETGHLSPELAEKARAVAAAVERALET